MNALDGAAEGAGRMYKGGGAAVSCARLQQEEEEAAQMPASVKE